jgi:predicted nuclease of predicted toxin-antitoxin system
VRRPSRRFSAGLLDQNVPRAIATWLRQVKPTWEVHHATEVGLAGKSDEELFRWGQAQGAIIITFDEDFADQRAFPVGTHHGIVRLRVRPTTVEETRVALDRLLTAVPEEELVGALVIIDRARIRIRRRKRSTS